MSIPTGKRARRQRFGKRGGSNLDGKNPRAIFRREYHKPKRAGKVFGKGKRI